MLFIAPSNLRFAPRNEHLLCQRQLSLTITALLKRRHLARLLAAIERAPARHALQLCRTKQAAAFHQFCGALLWLPVPLSAEPTGLSVPTAIDLASYFAFCRGLATLCP
jgi:hypothetical protein